MYWLSMSPFWFLRHNAYKIKTSWISVHAAFKIFRALTRIFRAPAADRASAFSQIKRFCARRQTRETSRVPSAVFGRFGVSQNNQLSLLNSRRRGKKPQQEKPHHANFMREQHHKKKTHAIYIFLCARRKISLFGNLHVGLRMCLIRANTAKW